jgi:hypothetical protein
MYRPGKAIRTPEALERQQFVYMLANAYPGPAYKRIITVKWVKNMNYAVIMYRLRMGLIWKAIKN